MKFGESLNEGLVPEWKDQYVDYRAGKKDIKKIAELWRQLNDRQTSDTTPLLDPLDDSAQYVPEMGLDADAAERELQHRRPLLFSFSVKLARQRKEEYIAERANFLLWLDAQLDKVDRFYTDKERDVYTRFLMLEDQFIQLKEQRVQLVRGQRLAELRAPIVAHVDVVGWAAPLWNVLRQLLRYDTPLLPLTVFLQRWRPLQKLLEYAMDTADEYDPNFRENQIRNGAADLADDDSLFSLELEEAETLQRPAPQTPQDRRRDYTAKRRFGVPYLYAKRQLKSALVEHYRAILLIRSYKTMNRTAFRKITKKFDKALGTNISADFMKRVDTEAYFLTLAVLDKILARVEDLYLSFFDREGDDRKHGLEKLRSATYAYNNADIRAPLYYPSTFLLGIFLGIGLPFFGIALYIALRKTLSDVSPEGKFMLQIWGGFGLLNLAMLLVGVNFATYAAFKINYKFIFEFNLATALDWKQYLLLPLLGFALMTALAWLTFVDFWPNSFPGRDTPLVFLAICLAIFLWPGTELYASSRRWLQVALWRMVCLGFYPVEFRDFFMADILCLLTYTLSNVSFFVCLYGDKWRSVLGGGALPSDTVRCGSTYSRSMGFFAALPSIWRFMQCARRYMDTGDAFPHVANMLKYLIGALYYCMLSLWRINRSSSHRALFVTFASLNSVYCAVWDIVMDWSLGQTNLKHFLLRDNLFYERPVYYYAAIIADVILRFQWIFYAFFTSQVQQLAVTSFCIALAELLRRFIWMFFRMENEHCTNVILFRASRDSPLPYMISNKVERAVNKLVEMRYDSGALGAEDDFSVVPDNKSVQLYGHTTAYNDRLPRKVWDEEGSVGRRHQRPDTVSLGHKKSTFVLISDALNRAHIKDFQRRKYSVPMESDDEDDDDGEMIKTVLSNRTQT